MRGAVLLYTLLACSVAIFGETGKPGFLPNGCPENNMNWLLPHETDCTLFYICNWGSLVLRQCGPGTHFNRVLQVCDWPQNAKCTTSSPFTPKPTTSQPASTGSTTQGPATPGPNTQGPTAPGPTTQGPATPGPTTQGLTTPAPTTQGPTTPMPTTQGATTPGLTTLKPTTTGPTTNEANSTGPATSEPIPPEITTPTSNLSTIPEQTTPGPRANFISPNNYRNYHPGFSVRPKLIVQPKPKPNFRSYCRVWPKPKPKLKLYKTYFKITIRYLLKRRRGKSYPLM